MKSFLDIVRNKVVVFDGAMGTNLQTQQLGPDDFGGEQYNGCNEYLVVTRPSAVAKVHEEFLATGCDVIETDTFGGTSIVLAEYGLGDESYRLNVEAARLARRIAADFSTSGRPRFVAGSMGPTTKLPSLGHIPFVDMERSYYAQAKGLVEGGADLLVVETCQDMLQAKAALAGIFGYFAEARKRVPVIASVTVEAMGTMLLGTEIAAALTTLAAYDVDVIGMNCATGPREMSESVRHLCAHSPKPVFVMPNAGIPENIGGHAHYQLSPAEMVSYLSHFVKDLGVSVVGGCCGTTPDHIKRLVDEIGSLEPSTRSPDFTPGCSSLYQSVPFHLDPAPVLIGERTNANGSKQFRDFLAVEDWEGMVAMGKEQVREGAHLIDVCTAYVGRDEARDIREIIFRYNTQITAPLMIDSTESHVIEEALRRIGGKAVVNSVNLEDGEERLANILPLCRKYGAAVVALTIDERGMAKTVDRKIEIARRIHALATTTYGMNEEDLIFDALTFTLASGDEEFRRAGLETIEAIRIMKAEFPRIHTSLGVSNISFGLTPPARHVLNSVFLHYAIDYGLDMAIVHASKIMPLYKISEVEREMCRRLIFDERTSGSDPLQDILKHFSRRKDEVIKPAAVQARVEDRLKNRIIDGNRVGFQEDLDEALKTYEPLDIINTILLDGMKVVGDLFGSGQMQLPFVLQSAEAMKASVSYLERFMDKAASASKGTMVIATVKGDVHDIGKNLVDIILTNNGYRVVNLGIQCPLEKMLVAANEYHADAIGMSGLLVKSTLIMKENLGVMAERGLSIPVILGGAALTRRYVEEDLRRVYDGPLYYANDAFDGLRFMERISAGRQNKTSPGTRKHTVGILIEDMERSYREMHALLEQIPDALYHAPKAVGAWSIHETVCHIIGWKEVCAERLKLYRAGRGDSVAIVPDDTVDKVNARMLSSFHDKSRKEIAEQLNSSSISLRESVTVLRDEDLGVTLGGVSVYEHIAENSFLHERHHMAAVKKYLGAHREEMAEDLALSGLEAKIALTPRMDPNTVSHRPGPADIPRAPFYGTKVVTGISPGEIHPYINEVALIRGQWQVRKGRRTDEEYRAYLEANIYPEYTALREQAIRDRLLEPKVVYGYFPCQSSGDDLIVHRPSRQVDPSGIWDTANASDSSSWVEWIRFTFPRQGKGKYLSISDYFTPVGSGGYDVVAFQLVTVGKVASEHAHRLFAENRYKEYLYFHGLAVESAEALAEYWHKIIRRELGIDGRDAADIRKLFIQHYQGSRYSFGYPACPSLEDQGKLFTLLRPERIGISLTGEYQLVPEQSTSAIIVHHPEAKYFNI